jgi:hypothetical protein
VNLLSEETRLAVARLVVENTELWETDSTCLGTFLPAVWKEILRMARAKKRQPAIDIRPLIQVLGPDEFIKEGGLNAVIEEIGLQRVVDEIGLDVRLAQLSPKQRGELKRRLEQS